MSLIKCPSCDDGWLECPNSSCDNGRVKTNSSIPFLDDFLDINEDVYENCDQCGGLGKMVCPNCNGSGEIEDD